MGWCSLPFPQLVTWSRISGCHQHGYCFKKPFLLLMAEILYHLRYMKPYKWWDKLPFNWCRISAINSRNLNGPKKTHVTSVMKLFRFPGTLTDHPPRGRAAAKGPTPKLERWFGLLVGWLVGRLVGRLVSFFVNILCVLFLNFERKNIIQLYVGLKNIRSCFHFSTWIFFVGFEFLPSRLSQRKSPWQRVAGKIMIFVMSLEWDMSYYPFPGRYFMVILCWIFPTVDGSGNPKENQRLNVQHLVNHGMFTTNLPQLGEFFIPDIFCFLDRNCSMLCKRWVVYWSSIPWRFLQVARALSGDCWGSLGERRDLTWFFCLYLWGCYITLRICVIYIYIYIHKFSYLSEKKPSG